MTAAKIAVTIPAETLKLARKQVKAGHAKSLSALVTQALDEKASRNELDDILDAMDRDFGKPNKAAQAWAKRVIKQSF
ncbi:MAG: hypothetical protein ABUL62_31980 [Myxococcales bacterium]